MCVHITQFELEVQFGESKEFLGQQPNTEDVCIAALWVAQSPPKLSWRAAFQ